MYRRDESFTPDPPSHKTMVRATSHPVATYCGYRDEKTWCTKRKGWCWKFPSCPNKGWER